MVGNTRDILFDVVGGVKVGDIALTSSNTLSGYTCELTSFEFTVQSPLPSDVSSDKFIWNLGDGTVVRGLSAKHIYSIPGMYTVSLIGYTSAGVECRSTETKQLSVSDFIPTRLDHVTSDVVNTHYIYQGQLAGRKNLPITINRYTSHQPHRVLSSTGYTLNLYASGSDSNALDPKNYKKQKWLHVDRTWSFYSAVTADNKTVSYEPIAAVPTTSENLYYRFGRRYNENDYYEQTVEKVHTSKIDTLTGTVFVGTSGTAGVYFADDSITKNDKAILAYISPDASMLPDYGELINGRSGAQYSPLPYLKQDSITVPIRSIPSLGTDLKFTSTGIPAMPLSKNKWQMNYIPFFANVADTDGVFITDFSPLTINPHKPGQAASTDTGVVNLSVIGSGSNALSAHFFRIKDGQLPSALSGAYRGVFIPIDASDNAQLVGNVKVKNPPGYLKDTILMWVANPELNTIYRGTLPGVKYISDNRSGFIRKSAGNIITQSASADTLAIATVPVGVGADINDSRVTTYMCDSSADNILAFDTYGNSLSTINLNYIKVAAGGSAQIDPIDLVTLSKGNSGNLAPSNVSIDGNRDIWITLTDAAAICKVDYNTGNVVNLITHPDNVNTGESINTIEPGIIDPDTDNNIWIAYVNPVSGSIKKYNTAGTTPTLTASHLFKSGEAPNDMVVDRDSNVWVATVNQQRTAVKTFTDTITAHKTTSGKDIVYLFGTSTDISDISTNQIIESSWPASYKEFTGKFLIKSLDSTSSNVYGYPYVTVEPYIGRANQISSSVKGISATTINVYPSDKVYKFNSSGTKLVDLSGFFKPGYITVDTNQSCWVSHDSNSITEIKDGSVNTTIRCETTEFLSVSAPTFNLRTYNSSQIGGIAGDTFSGVVAINTLENKIMRFSIANSAISSSVVIDSSPAKNSILYRAYGDWTGFRWLNKYMNKSSALAVLTGATTFNIYPSAGKFNIAKQNENFDPAETIKSYRFQDQLFNYEQFFDSFYGQIVGNLSAHPTALGRTIYEKIANFPNNIGDVDVCNVNALYSVCNQFNVPVNDYNFNYIGGLSRAVNLLSTQHKKLWGHRSKFNRDFRTYGSSNLSAVQLGINLGNKLTTSTYIVTAGVPIVAEQLFNREFRIINPMYLSGGPGDPGYLASVKMVQTYPLSSYSSNWGWGLLNDTSNVDIAKYYNFYEHTPDYNNVQVEGVIDWQNPYTNISETVSGVDSWVGDNNIADAIIDYELRRGLGLFNDTLSATSTSLQ